jgi:hypothetical protein
MVKFIMHTSFVTNFTVLRTLELHMTETRIGLHIFFWYNKTTAMKCSLSSRKESVVFTSITLLIELFVNCSELKVMQCSMTKSVPKFGLQK